MDQRKPRERLLGPALRAQPDPRLVALARDGSEPAQEEIVRRYRAALVRYAGSIVGAAAAEDVVQEALAKATAALRRADDELRLRPWLYAIVRNAALNHLRDAGPATEQLDESYDGVEQPPQALERREQVRALVGGLRRLPRQQREALVKRELEGRSHDEIGADLGVSSGAARQLIFRGREALRVGFGSLLPMPLLRWLAESGGDGAVGVAAGAGGGALAAKAAVAVFAAGAAVTAGVAIDHGARQRPEPPAAEAAVRPAMVAPAAGQGAEWRLEAVAEPGSGRDDSVAGDDHSGRGGDDSSGRGRGEQRAGDDGRGGGSGPSPSSGPGSSGDDDSSSGGDGERSGHGGHEGGSGGDDSRSGSSHGGRNGDSGGGGGGGHSGDDSSGHDGSASTSGGSSGSGSSGGSGTGGSGSGSGSSGSGSGSSSGGSDAVEATSSPAPAPTSSDSGSVAPAPTPVESGSGGSGSSGGGGSGSSSEIPRDLSGGTGSQGSYDPDSRRTR
ncbi:MAG TPA: sigma-70 family RNA polymerase sigma factor [Solirubrobacterales bacterium]|jgi:RNA polymerase sigma factor (sigma-70 family)